VDERLVSGSGCVRAEKIFSCSSAVLQDSDWKNSSGMLPMPRSLMSSEEEMAQSCSDSGSSESDGSREEHSSRGHVDRRDSMLICVVIPDLQQSGGLRLLSLGRGGPRGTTTTRKRAVAWSQRDLLSPFPSVDSPRGWKGLPKAPEANCLWDAPRAAGERRTVMGGATFCAVYRTASREAGKLPFSLSQRGLPCWTHLACLKSVRFDPDATVWVAKQQILCTLTQSLRDVLNYGLFRPSVDGRESGFLEEEKALKDQALPANKGVPTLEFRYKSRVYQHANINEKQIEKLHTQANLRRFMDYIQHHQLDKVTKLLERGLDPNYHDPDTGETPLTLAAHLDNVVEVIEALKSGGAHLDFRSRDGMTALHKAARARNQIALKVGRRSHLGSSHLDLSHLCLSHRQAMLELGASPDYKDRQGLTPLYHTVTVGGDPSCCEVLLQAHATMTCHDENGWHEVHQACRYGHAKHLEHLLFYGADMQVQNATGNTALHICALYKEETCARVLLERGVNRDIKNHRGQTPFQVAIIAGNFELAEFIKNYKATDLVPFREAAPVCSGRGRAQQTQAQRGRSTLAAPRVLLRSNSDNNLNVNKLCAEPSPSYSPLRSLSPHRHQQMQNRPNGTVKTMGRGARPPRSRSPSLGRLGEVHTRRHAPPRHSRSVFVYLSTWERSVQKVLGRLRFVYTANLTTKSSSQSSFPGSGSKITGTVARKNVCLHALHGKPHQLCAVPGVMGPRPSRDGFSGMDTPGSKRKLHGMVPGKHYVVVKSYQPKAEGEITLYKNDRVKVLSVGEGGFWEGSARGNMGWFPAECVEEIPNKPNEDRPSLSLHGYKHGHLGLTLQMREQTDLNDGSSFATTPWGHTTASTHPGEYHDLGQGEADCHSSHFTFTQEALKCMLKPTPGTMKHRSARAAAAMMRMAGCNNGRCARDFLHSDCVIDEKTVLLQKKDNEGFGFVLRGAKVTSLSPSLRFLPALLADTPIEEFTPTPAFPALQYLESVDEGGVAWQAGLRTGDFLIEEPQDERCSRCFSEVCVVSLEVQWCPLCKHWMLLLNQIPKYRLGCVAGPSPEGGWGRLKYCQLRGSSASNKRKRVCEVVLDKSILPNSINRSLSKPLTGALNADTGLCSPGHVELGGVCHGEHGADSELQLSPRFQVNQDNVVKVGHKQVVNMIRHGGNHLIIKVVTVSRNLDPDDTARKKAPPPARRAPSTALCTRSKSMTSELEDIVMQNKSTHGRDNALLLTLLDFRSFTWPELDQWGIFADKVEEVVPPQKPVWESANVDVRVAAVKPRPTSRSFAVAPEMNVSVTFNPIISSLSLAGCFAIEHKKSAVGLICRCCPNTGVTEEEKQFLTPPMLKFTRSLSMPDTSEDIPPPPAVSPPSPPHNAAPPPSGRGYGTIRAGFTPQTPPANSTPPDRGDPGWKEQGVYYRDSPEQYDSEVFNHSPTAQQSLHMRRAQVPENPYSDVGKAGHSALFVPNKPARRKGVLVKQPNVEDSPEKTCSILIPTIIIKEPSTSSSGKSSQGSSMEIETSTPDHPGQLRPEDPSGPFVSAMASGPVRDREKRLEALRNSPSFRSTDAGDEDVASMPAPRLRHSKSIDEGMFSSDERLRRLMAPPTSLLSIPRGGGNVTDFNSPEPTMVRELLSTRTGHSPVSLPAHKTYSSGSGNYVHPVTGKPLDPNSPLALALAARDRAMREQSQPMPLKSDSSKLDLNKPLFIDTKLRPSLDVSFSSTATMGRPRVGLRRQMTESKYETESKYQLDPGKPEKRAEEKKNMLMEAADAAQQKSAGLLMVHTADGDKSDQSSPSEGDRDEDGCLDSTPGELRDPNQPVPANPPPLKSLSAAPQGKTIITVNSVDEPVKLPFGIPPPPLASVDIDEEFVFGEPLPPPLEFANSFDIPDDQTGALAELLKQKATGVRGPSLTPFYPHLVTSNSDISKRPTVLTNCTPPSFPTGPLEPYEPIIDSGIEVDSRSSGDPQLETTSTVSTVSSISTLSSEGGETLDTCTVYADGQAFMVDRAQVLPKQRVKHAVNKSNALYKDTLNAEGVASFRPSSSVPPPPPPPPPGTAAPDPPKTPTQRTSKLWGESHGPEAKSQPMADTSSALQHMNKDKTPKPAEVLDSPAEPRTHFGRNPDGVSLVSGTQQNATVTFTAQPGPNVPAPLACRQGESLPPRSPRSPRAPSPIMSPPDSGLSCASSLPASITSPTMTEVFGLPTPPLSLGTGCSRSPSPLTLIQAASSKPFAAKPVLGWSKQDVADWLESLNLAEHRDAFMDNDIEGSHLPNLQKQDLIDLGVTRVGHRMNIERALKALLDR
ncbi:hypothetical protein P4O66_020599, partial [Electrophorus voltai]